MREPRRCACVPGAACLAPCLDLAPLERAAKERVRAERVVAAPDRSAERRPVLRLRQGRRWLVGGVVLMMGTAARAAPVGALDRLMGDVGGQGGEPIALSIQLLLVMGLLTLLPTLC